MAVLPDTNIISGLLRPSPDPSVDGWVGERLAENLYFPAVGEVELPYGVAILPTGRRRDALARAIEAILRKCFEERVLAFDSAAAREYADTAATRRIAGRPVAPTDCLIGAIARSLGMALATRNVRDFEDMDINVVSPWTVE